MLDFFAFIVFNLLPWRELYRLHHDLLLTHSAPALMKKRPDDLECKATYLEPGELTVWRWLGMDRFFPPDKGDIRQSILRGCASVSLTMYCIDFETVLILDGRTIKKAVGNSLNFELICSYIKSCV